MDAPHRARHPTAQETGPEAASRPPAAPVNARLGWFLAVLLGLVPACAEWSAAAQDGSPEADEAGAGDGKGPPTADPATVIPARQPLVIGADPDPEAPFSKEWVEQTYVEVFDALAAAGCELPSQVPVVVAGNQEALDRRREFAKTMDDKEGLTYGMDVMADFLMGEHILGRYFPDEKAFYIFEENVLRGHDDAELEHTREFIWAIMAHEMVHAYDDQTYENVPTIDEVLVDIGQGNRMAEVNATMTLLEGRATWVAELACEHAGVRKLPARSMEDVRDVQLMKSDGSAAQDVGAGVLNFVGRAKLAQYVSGREFAKRAWAMGGEPFFRQVFDSLPLSMAEVEDFDKFFIRWAEDMEARESATSDDG